MTDSDGDIDMLAKSLASGMSMVVASVAPFVPATRKRKLLHDGQALAVPKHVKRVRQYKFVTVTAHGRSTEQMLPTNVWCVILGFLSLGQPMSEERDALMRLDTNMSVILAKYMCSLPMIAITSSWARLFESPARAARLTDWLWSNRTLKAVTHLRVARCDEALFGARGKYTLDLAHVIGGRVRQLDLCVTNEHEGHHNWVCAKPLVVSASLETLTMSGLSWNVAKTALSFAARLTSLDVRQCHDIQDCKALGQLERLSLPVLDARLALDVAKSLSRRLAAFACGVRGTPAAFLDVLKSLPPDNVRELNVELHTEDPVALETKAVWETSRFRRLASVRLHAQRWLPVDARRGEMMLEALVHMFGALGDTLESVEISAPGVIDTNFFVHTRTTATRLRRLILYPGDDMDAYETPVTVDAQVFSDWMGSHAPCMQEFAMPQMMPTLLLARRNPLQFDGMKTALPTLQGSLRLRLEPQVREVRADELSALVASLGGGAPLRELGLYAPDPRRVVVMDRAFAKAFVRSEHMRVLELEMHFPRELFADARVWQSILTRLPNLVTLAVMPHEAVGADAIPLTTLCLRRGLRQVAILPRAELPSASDNELTETHLEELALRLIYRGACYRLQIGRDMYAAVHKFTDGRCEFVKNFPMQAIMFRFLRQSERFVLEMST